MYHGRIILPPSYPLRPPSFRFLTPSGRFEVNREICLSISGHHEETWQPAWGIRTALWALRAFMEGEAKGQVGGMEMGEAERRRLAGESRGWRCQGCGGRSNEEIMKEQEDEAGKEENGERKQEAIPEELKLGFKDEMGKEAQGSKPMATRENPIPASSKVPSFTATSISSSSSALPPNPSLQASLPSTTNTLFSQPLQPQPRQPQPTPTTQISTPEAVPGWIDKAIVGLVAGLGVMVIKKMMV